MVEKMLKMGEIIFLDCFLLDQNKVISDGWVNSKNTGKGGKGPGSELCLGRPRAIWRGVEWMIHTILSECPLIIQTQIGITPHHIMCILYVYTNIIYIICILCIYILNIYIYTHHIWYHIKYTRDTLCFFPKSSKTSITPGKFSTLCTEVRMSHPTAPLWELSSWTNGRRLGNKWGFGRTWFFEIQVFFLNFWWHFHTVTWDDFFWGGLLNFFGGRKNMFTTIWVTKNKIAISFMVIFMGKSWEKFPRLGPVAPLGGWESIYDDEVDPPWQIDGFFCISKKYKEFNDICLGF